MKIYQKIVILVLGIGSASLAHANVPVVFLHGWEGSADNWNNMTNLLVQNGGYVAGDLHPIDYWDTYRTSIQVYAHRVSQEIASWLATRSEEYGMSYQVDIVAHSMGGLIVRDIIANNWNQGKYGIRRVVTLATPHYGQKQELGETAEQMKYGSSYLWDLAEKWEFENKKIGSVLCVAGVDGASLDDKLVDYWSAALSDCPTRYVNKVHMHITGDVWNWNGPPIYACEDGVADSVYLLVRNYLLHGNILNQTACGVSLQGRKNRGGAVCFKVQDVNGKAVRYGKNHFVKEIEPRPESNYKVHTGSDEKNYTGSNNSYDKGVGTLTSARGTYYGMPEGQYAINFYDSEASDDGESMCVKTPSFTSESIEVKNDRTTVCYITPTQNASDFVFLIDSTGSMSGNISSARAQAKSILAETLAKSPQSRFAVVEYRDFPVSPYGSSGDFTHKVRCQFTSNQSAVLSALNAITTGGGADTEESLYSAVVACADGGELGGWLNSNRSIIVMTDAGPHDPEPYTGYTRSQVASILAANGVVKKSLAKTSSGSGIGLYAVLTSSSSSLKSLYSGLCGDTGGTAAFASSSAEVGTIIHDLVQTSAARVDADWFVNASSGNDANDGLTWATAKRTIGAFDGIVKTNDVVAVAAGVYSPVLMTNDTPVIFRNINDSGTVIIDAGFSNRCVAVPSRSITFDGFVFRNGLIAGNGGGALNGTYENCIFTNNYASKEVRVDVDSVSTNLSYGGAAYDAKLKSCRVIGNGAEGHGGGVAHCQVIQSTLAGNKALRLNEFAIGGNGGAAASSSLIRCRVENNVADESGGGAFQSSALSTLFVSNRAGVVGGADNGSALTNCTVVANSAPQGAGVACAAAVNSIVWNNLNFSNELSNVLNSDLTYSCTMPEVSGSGNISKNPLFRDDDYQYCLSAESPCVDNGNSVEGVEEVDLKDEIRIYGSSVDLGAYEYCAAPDVPTNVCASSGTYFSGINVTWNDAYAAATYQLWRSTSSDMSSASLVATVTTNRYLDTTTDTGCVYYYYLTAKNSGGESPHSEIVSGAKMYFPPDGVSAGDGTARESITVEWTSTSGAYYKVYRTDNLTNDFVSISEWAQTSSYVDNEIETNRYYYYAVSCALNADGVGASSLSTVDRGFARGDRIYVNHAGNVDDSPCVICTDVQSAVSMASDGDVVLVSSGEYSPFSSENKAIRIISVDGAYATIIDGGGTNRCATLGSSVGDTNVVLQGFTLRNGNADYASTARNYGGGVCFGTIKDCYVVNNFASSRGGGVANANVFDSAIVGNCCGEYSSSNGSGGGIAWNGGGFVAERCYIAENNAGYGSAIYHQSGNASYVRDSTIVHNTARGDHALASSTRYALKIERCTVSDNDCMPAYRPGMYYSSAYDSIIYYNYARPNNYNSQSCYGLVSNCCTTVEGSSCIEYGTVKTEPAFVDRAHRVYDLTAAAGENIVGAGKVVDLTDKFVVGVEIVGHGAVLQPGAVVDAGESRTFVAAEIGRAFEGFYTNGVFATAEQQLTLNDIRENIIVQARFQKRTAYVSESGSDDNDGLTASTPKRTLNAAVALVENDEAIEVAAGRYAPVKSYGKRIRIYSTAGAESTIIDAAGSGRCADLADFYSGTTNTVLVGFTLTGGYAEYGAGAYYGTLDRCMVEHNEADRTGGGTQATVLHNSIVRWNRAVLGGGCYNGRGYNLSVCANEADLGGGVCEGSWYNSVIRGNRNGSTEVNYSSGSYFNVFTYPKPSGSRNFDEDPMLVDAWNGDVRLLAGSPCLNAGCNDYVMTSVDINGAERIQNDVVDIGAVEGTSVAGNVVSVHVDGGGSVSNTTFIVSAGGSVTIQADETVRPLDYFDVGSVRYTDNPLTLSDVTSNIQVSAVFQRFTFYVDAGVPSSGDGLSWASAFKTLQEGVDAALEDETVFVADGTYDSITTHNKKITIEGVNGATKTFINGQGSTRCATLGVVGINGYSINSQTRLVGFTLRNGFAVADGSYSYGGGTYGGTLEQCIISNCQANASYSAQGGGAYYGILKNCLLVANRSVGGSYGYGGGCVGSILYNCTVVENSASGGNASYGGGSAYGRAYNSILWGNSASNGLNAYNASLYYCCADSTSSYLYSGTITDDPLFADADSGDYHLSPGSPCLNTGYDYYGSTDQDLDGKRRIQSGAVDMGCYEGATYTEAPGEVSGVMASGGKLIWDPLVAAASYLVYRSETDDEYDAVLVGASATAEYEDTTAEEGVTYWYWVRAINPLGMGPMGEAAEMVWPDPLEITTSELPEGTESEPYEVQLEATGGTGDYTWRVVPDTGCLEKYSSTSTFELTGTAQGWQSDDQAWTYSLPFAFPFFGGVYTKVYVGSNGTLSFGGAQNSYSASESYLANSRMIAGYWCDLLTTGTSYDIFVDNGDSFVTFRWAARHYSGGTPVNFSITLYESGAVRLSYGEGNATGAMIGYSAGDGENYYISSYSQSGSMENADDIWFFADLPPGITLSEDGVLSGDCSLVWDSEFTVAVEDELGETAEMTYSLVINENPNARPEITAVSPADESSVNVRIGESQTFAVEASDPDGEALQYFWCLDDVRQEASAESNSFTYSPALADHGSHTLTCYVSDGYWTNKVFAAWQINACHDIYVDANVAEPGEGYAWATAMKSLNVACTYAVDGDKIFVADGVYEPIVTADKKITITSVNGANATFIDGGNSNRCARLSTANTGTNTVLEGFTLINGYQGNSYYVYGGGSWGGTLNYCVISNCHIVASTGNNGYDGAYGGASYYGVLNNCLVVGNSADSPYYARGGGLCYSTIRNCTIVGNSVSGGTTTRGTEYGYGGGSYGGTAYNSIFAYNSADIGTNAYNVSMYYCCALGDSTRNRVGSITDDPQFVDAEAGDYRLLASSPCRQAGNNNYVIGEKDLVGDDRILRDTVNMGCFEEVVFTAIPETVTGVIASEGALAWDGQLQADVYRVYRNTMDDSTGATLVLTTRSTAWEDESIVRDGTYWYWVVAVNDLGESLASASTKMLWPKPLVIATESLPAGVENEPYSVKMDAEGGTEPYAWTTLANSYVLQRDANSFVMAGTNLNVSWSTGKLYALPFEFDYYGKRYDSVYVNQNGTITFDKGSTSTYRWQSFTNAVIIAPMMGWFNYNDDDNGVFVSETPDSVTFRWCCENVYTDLICNFAATLYADGSIRFSYGDGYGNYTFAGLSAGDGNRYSQGGSGTSAGANMRDLVFTPALVESDADLPPGIHMSQDGMLEGVTKTTWTNHLVVSVSDFNGWTTNKTFDLIIGPNPNLRPVIDAISPSNDVIYVLAGNSATFSVAAHDPESASLLYAWYVDGELVEDEALSTFTYNPTTDDYGYHDVECVVSDGYWFDEISYTWEVKVARTMYVDIEATGEGTGETIDDAYTSIQDAMYEAEDGDLIYVAPGVYEPFYCRSDSITIKSLLGYMQTIIDCADGYGVEGGDFWRAEYEQYDDYAPCQPTIDGFTIQNAIIAAYGAKLVNCKISGVSDSAAQGCQLENCILTQNAVLDALLYQCRLVGCSIAGNTVGSYALGYGCRAYNSVVSGNSLSDGTESNYTTDTDWEWTGEDYAEVPTVQFFNSCTYPMPEFGSGNIDADPLLVDTRNGDLRLRAGSPCVDAALAEYATVLCDINGDPRVRNAAPDIGAIEGAPVEGLVISAQVIGGGSVSPVTAVVGMGADAAFVANGSVRPFLLFETNGVWATSSTNFTWRNICGDGTLTAVFSNFTFYVDAASGDDGNDGLSWVTAKRTLQDAVTASLDGETIFVRAGEYAPISTANKKINIIAVDGADETIIDGASSERCATLSETSEGTNTTLIGFTFRNGYASTGGGVYGGTLRNCIITGNTAIQFGGGCAYTYVHDSQVVGNSVLVPSETNSWGSYIYSPGQVAGGGAYYGYLVNCAILQNAVVGNPETWYVYGGGVAYSTVIGCVVAENEIDGYCDRAYGGGAYDSEAVNCTIVKNRILYDPAPEYEDYAAADGGGFYGWWCPCVNSVVYGNTLNEGTNEIDEDVYDISGSIIGEDPGFVDYEGGDYSVGSDSPCVDGGYAYVFSSWNLPECDIAGNLRVQGESIDIGAYEVAQEFYVERTSVELNSVEQEYGFAFRAASAWTAESSASWVSIAQNAGSASSSLQNLTLTVDENDTGLERTATITLHVGASDIVITVTQLAKVELPTGSMRYYGLFVGLNEYLYVSSLNGCVPDAHNMMARCLSHGYWNAENVTALTDDQATKDAVREKIAQMARVAKAGDVVVFFQSSHGGNVTDAYGNQTDDVFLCEYDSYYYDYELAEDLSAFKAGVKLVVVVDACHSGGLFKAIPDEDVLVANGVTIDNGASSSWNFAQRIQSLMKKKSSRTKSLLKAAAKDDTIDPSEIGWMTACDSDQVSYDTSEGGMFTGAMLDGWETGYADGEGYGDGDGYLNFYELFKYARERATGYGDTDAQCLNEDVLIKTVVGVPDGSDRPALPGLPEALDATNVTWVTGFGTGWFAQSDVTHDGESAAQSGAIGHAASSVLSGFVSGSGTLSFWWKVSSEANRDKLNFSLDGEGHATISGEQDWQQVTIAIDGEGEHLLTWAYAKSKSGIAGSDCGWVDRVVWTPDVAEEETEVTLAEALDTTNVIWSTSGNANWQGVDNGIVDFARSGAIDDDEESVLSTTLVGPGELSFRWKTSCEEYDGLDLELDGEVVRWASGETDWTTVTLSLTSGSHTLKWIYWKDESDAEGEDCAYVDQVVWTSSAPAVTDPIPDLGETPTAAAVQEALVGSEDDRLTENITNGVTYNAYREWANTVELPSGGKAGAQAVKDSPNAWLSFAIDSATLIETLPQEGDVKIETFDQTAISGSYNFTVSVDNIMVGDDAEPSNLAKVFGIEGGTSLEPGGLSSENINITFGTPENGKVKFTAGPKDVDTGTFFMRVKMTP